MPHPDPETVERILEKARSTPVAQREALVRAECGSDEALLAAVRSRLQAEGMAIDPDATIDLEVDPASQMTIDIEPGGAEMETIDVDASPDSDQTMELEDESEVIPAEDVKGLPDQINDFRIIGLLGRGGMGAVYLAEQMHPRRRVALKVIRSRTITPDSLKRFEVEGHTLAKLSHPGIAQVFAAGVHEEAGQSVPFFAMEYVEDSIAITDWAKQHDLGIRERLEMFADMCDAVAHGHQRGVIHRDLKPQNIIVNDVAGLKVIDFGVAQVEEDGSKVDQKRQIVGTLQYMPPEQVKGEMDVDTSTDVYALGVLLYELLVGKPPYKIDTTSVAAATKSIIEAPIPSIHASNPEIGLDLDAVVRKAVSKEREDRYPTASELGAEVRRYLADEPVNARQPTTSESLRRYMRKNRAAATAITAISIVVIAGLVAVSIFAYRTEIARSRLAKIVSFQSEMIGSLEPNDMGRTLVEELAASVGDRLRQAGVPEEEIAAAMNQQEAMSSTYNPTEVAVQLIDEHMLKRALATVPSKFAEDKATEADVREIVADAYDQLGRYALAEPEHERALEIRTELHGREHERTLRSVNSLGLLRMNQGRHADAQVLLVEAVDGRKSVLGIDHPDTIASVQNLGTLAHRMGDETRAEALWLEALASAERVYGELHPMTIVLTGNLGVLYSTTGRVDEAEVFAKRNYELNSKLYGENHSQALAARRGIAQIALVRGNVDKAATIIEEVVAGYREAVGDRHPDTLSSITALGTLRLQQGQPEEAVDLFRSAYEGRVSMLGDEHPDTFLSLQQLAQAHLIAQKIAESEPHVRAVVAGFTAQVGEAHPQTLVWVDTLALVLRDTGQFQEALVLIDRIHFLCGSTDGLSAQPICQSVPSRYVRLYTLWHEQSPDHGYDALAGEWQAKIDAAAQPTS